MEQVLRRAKNRRPRKKISSVFYKSFSEKFRKKYLTAEKLAKI
jgi:hypothetical protein